MHPLEEMRLVSKYKNSFQSSQENLNEINDNNENIENFSLLQEDVIYVSTNRKLPIIVTFDKEKQIHKVWKYNKFQQLYE